MPPISRLVRHAGYSKCILPQIGRGLEEEKRRQDPHHADLLFTFLQLSSIFALTSWEILKRSEMIGLVWDSTKATPIPKTPDVCLLKKKKSNYFASFSIRNWILFVKPRCFYTALSTKDVARRHRWWYDNSRRDMCLDGSSRQRFTTVECAS